MGPGQPSATAESIWQLSTGFFMAARVVQTACDAGIFDRLASGPRDAPGVAMELGVDLDGIEAILVACAALGVLERSGDGRYRNGAVASTFLQSQAPGSMRAMVQGALRSYERWVDLPARLASGGRDATMDTCSRAAEAEHAGIFQTSWPEALAFAGSERFARARRVLDLGGGTAPYAIAICRRWPHVRVDLVDLPDVVPLAMGRICVAGLERRISIHAGDYQEVELPSDYDLTLLMNVVHLETPDRARRLIARAAQTLAPRGHLAIQDIFLNETSTGPAMAALLGVHAYLERRGRVHSIAAVADWVKDAGLVVVEREQRARSGFTTIVGRRQEGAAQGGPAPPRP